MEVSWEGDRVMIVFRLLADAVVMLCGGIKILVSLTKERMRKEKEGMIIRYIYGSCDTRFCHHEFAVMHIRRACY